MENIIKYWPYLATTLTVLSFIMGYLYNSQLKDVLSLKYSNYSTNRMMLKSKRKEISRALLLHIISISLVCIIIIVTTSPVTLWVFENYKFTLTDFDYPVTFYTITYFLILILFIISSIVDYKLIKKYFKFLK